MNAAAKKAPPSPRQARRQARRQTGRRARRRGLWAEVLSAWWLRGKGYRIEARNWRPGGRSGGRSGGRGSLGEIDLIARRGPILAVVEVKARPTQTQAAFALTPRQRARIRRAAQAFLAARPELSHLSLRFDAILVAPWRMPVHIHDAWREGLD